MTIKQGKIAFCVEKEKGGTNRNKIQKIKRLEWNERKKERLKAEGGKERP